MAAAPNELRSACDVCHRHCSLAPGQTGACRARTNVDGQVVPSAYGRLTSIAIDPIEKKPLARFRPGTYVLSVGSYGCNLRCPFCQNHTIAQAGEHDVGWREVAPEELVELAVRERRRDPRMTGIAFTYNEPLVCWEYVRDCSVLAHEEGLATVLVSNGCANPQVIGELNGLIDAANIDLKCFTQEGYERLGGSLELAMGTIELMARDPSCHLEVTTLVVPGLNDDEDEIDAMARWLASLGGIEVHHVTRYHPAWRMRKGRPTPVADVYRLAEVARRHLPHVRVGNC